MAAFIIATVVGAIVAVVYLVLALGTFKRVRDQRLAELAAGPATTRGSDEIDPHQADGFTWKAGLGVLASVGVLVLISIAPAFWYLIPALAIGSAIAVIVAFLIDPA
jgi:putative flippase GtrA